MDIKCTECGRELEVPGSLVGRQGQCPFCSALFYCAARPTENVDVHNSSGKGGGARIPEEIERWNWGAFFWTWIWAVFNRVWLGLAALLPVGNLIMPFVLGAKGNEWAWRNKRWKSVEHFTRVQKKWSIAGWAAVAVVLGVFLVTVVFPDVRP